MARRTTRQVTVGTEKIGGDAPVLVQSMLSAPQGNVEENLIQARSLYSSGCKLIRLSVSHESDIEVIRHLVQEVPAAFVADIHQRADLVLPALKAGIHKIRVNPRYLGGEEKLLETGRYCKEYNVPIRIGVNSGSLEKDLLEEYGGPTAEALAESALRSAKLLDESGFSDIVISIKSADIRTMIEANRIVANRSDYPLHLGVTEAGTVHMGSIKSAIGIGSLLADGIGDTIRVSLTGDPTLEIPAANDILRALDLLPDTPQLISCPTCGRTGIDLIAIANEVEERLKSVHKPISVAVMGCPINGPGEAKNADLGIAGGDGVGLLFKKGEVLRKVPEDQLVDELFLEIERY